MEKYQAFEIDILKALRDISSPFLDGVMNCFSFLAEYGWFFILTAIVLLAFKKTRRPGLAMALALIFEFVICNLLLKPIAARPRPYFADPSLVPGAVVFPGDYSFPSGHSACVFAAAFSLRKNQRTLHIIYLVPAFFVAFSRIFLGLHYPGDVIAGSVIGVLCGFAGEWAADRLFHE